VEILGAHVRSIEKVSMYTRFLTSVGLRCMDIFYLALASALKEHSHELSNDFLWGVKRPTEVKKVGAGALCRESEYVYSLFQKCWFEAYGHL